MKRFFTLPYRFAALFTALAVGFSVFVLLDAFVIPHAYQTVQGDVPRQTDSTTISSVSVTDALTAVSDADTASSASDNSVSSSGSAASSSTTDPSGNAADLTTNQPPIPDGLSVQYQDDTLAIALTTLRQWDTQIYVADVWCDPARLATAFAQNTYGRNIKQTTSSMAAEHGAVLAINGDYYGFRRAGYVIRNGVLYRSAAASATQQDLVIYGDGRMEIIREGEITAEQLLADGAVQVFSFGPALVENGEVSVAEGQEVAQSKISNPRTAVGIAADGHYVIAVSDGRTDESAGLTLYQLAQLLVQRGCVTAYNLDGGGSSTLVFNGQLINTPTDGRSSGERKVSDIVYFA